MGVMNLRAICPNCGGKIHTQPKGLGHLTWARSWFLVQTGKSCQHCGVALTGKVKMDNKAELAPNQPMPSERTANAAEPDTTTELVALSELHASGALSDAEFAAAKERVLDSRKRL